MPASPNKLFDYVALSLETSGHNPQTDEIIEIGLLQISGGKPVKKLETFIQPVMPLSEAAAERTGISNDMLATAPSLEDVMPHVDAFIGERTVVLHNARLTVAFLREAGRRCLDKSFPAAYVDISRMSRNLNPDRDDHTLSGLARRFGVAESTSHQALADAVNLYKCYEALSEHPAARRVRGDTPLPRPVDEDAPARKKRRALSLGKAVSSVKNAIPVSFPSLGGKRWLLPAIAGVLVVGVAAALLLTRTPAQQGSSSPFPPASETLAPVNILSANATDPLAIQDDEPTPLPAITTPPPAATQAPPTTITATMLREGEVGDDVRALQARLIELGYLTGTADGQFGSATKKAVKEFQQNHGLSADGVAGELTIAAMFDSQAKQASQTSTASVAGGDKTVWVPLNDGKYYHLRASCSELQTPSQSTLQEAVDAGYEPCPLCGT